MSDTETSYQELEFTNSLNNRKYWANLNKVRGKFLSPFFLTKVQGKITAPFLLKSEIYDGYTNEPPLFIAAEVKENLRDDTLIFDSLESVYLGKEKSKEFTTLIFGREITEEGLIDVYMRFGSCEEDEELVLLVFTVRGEEKEETKGLVFNSSNNGKIIGLISLRGKLNHPHRMPIELEVTKYCDFYILRFPYEDGVCSCCSKMITMDVIILPISIGDDGDREVSTIESIPINEKYFGEFERMYPLFEKFSLKQLLVILKKENLFHDEKKTLRSILKIGDRIITSFSTRREDDVILFLKSEVSDGSIVEFPLEYDDDRYYLLYYKESDRNFHIENGEGKIIFEGKKSIEEFLLLLERKEVSLRRMCDGGRSLLNFVERIITK